MKLLYWAHVRLPTERAHGLQIMKMCRAFARAVLGLEVELVVPQRKNHLTDEPFHYYGVERCFKLTFLPGIDPLLHEKIWGALGHLAATTLFYWRAWRHAKKTRPDIIYTREWPVALLTKQAVVELHNIPRGWSWWFKLAMRRARKIVALNSLLRAELVARDVATAKIIIAADGVDLEDFLPAVEKNVARAQLNLPTERPIVMYTGSLYYYGWKGVDVFVQAAALCPEILFVIVGGEITEIAEIKKHFITTNILFVPLQPHKLIPIYLQAADVLILPNIAGDKMSECYTSPLKLFEYMAAGRPIIASDLPAMREVLNEQLAELVMPGSVTALVDAIKKILSDSTLANTLAQSAGQEVKRYTWWERARKIAASVFYV